MLLLGESWGWDYKNLWGRVGFQGLVVLQLFTIVWSSRWSGQGYRGALYVGISSIFRVWGLGWLNKIFIFQKELLLLKTTLQAQPPINRIYGLVEDTEAQVRMVRYFHVHVRMSVCPYVCMYVCPPVCMCACMHVCKYACMDAWMHGCMDVWMYGCMYVCM